MKKGTEIFAQVSTAILMIVNFFFPMDIIENSRVKFIIYVIKNSLFEIVLLLIAVTLYSIITKHKSFVSKYVKDKWNTLNYNSSSVIKKVLLLANVMVLFILLGYVAKIIFKERVKNFSYLQSSFYAEGLYQSEILIRKGDLDNAIDSYDSYAVSFYKGRPDQNKIINDKIDKIVFTRNLSEENYQKFEKSFTKYGLTRVNFFLLFEAYCLYPYNPVIEVRFLEIIEILKKANGRTNDYYNAVIAQDYDLVKKFDQDYGHFFVEHGLIEEPVSSKEYWIELNNIFLNFTLEEYTDYIKKSWRFESMEKKLSRINNNKSI